MKPTGTALLAVLLLVVLSLTLKEWTVERPESDPPDGCIICHLPDKDPSRAHTVSAIGCAVCHMGSPFAGQKARAHKGMVRNPGRLDVAAKTCGQKDCHPKLPQRVEKSLMATNRGILAVMQELWPHEIEETVLNVKTLSERPKGASMALDHFRKMCGGCHLYRPRYPNLGQIGKRGGGCTDCHIVELLKPNRDLAQKDFQHPGLTTKIPSKNCIKCHNRSARIGLSYFGRFESEGYGTPFMKGAPGPRQLSGGRFYLELPADVHHRKAGMSCIDCHTEKGVMGDGKVYEHQEQQVDIDCATCHEPELKSVDPDPELTRRLIRAAGRRVSDGKNVRIFSPKESPLYHVTAEPDGKMILYRKQDGKAITYNRLSKPEVHKASYHKRLTCQACHSKWIPQCYGCHEMLFKQADQRDWLTGKRSVGRWQEGRSYLRFRRPTLGIRPGDRVGPFAPGCQVFINVFDEKGKHRPDAFSRHLVMASFDPHTTALKVPACEGCHLDPKIIGLGEGNLKITANGPVFQPVYNSAESGLGIDFPLEAFVSCQGEPLQAPSRENSRPFNQEELTGIIRVGLCIPCHDRYQDPVYKDFDGSFGRFMAGDTPCRRNGL